ncbi:MAG: hypothetical protein CR993_00805 [Rhodobacterales bacterium]|nr:MAG: hypothetical protein CR993_00805 [Rhodobacterales bacterium]
MTDSKISKDLFLSILAMDAYNRGYDAGIADGEGDTVVDSDGNLIDKDGLGLAGKQVGAAIVLNVPLPTDSEANSFYALSYEITGDNAPEGLAGKTVVSFRGTDNLNPFSNWFGDGMWDPGTGFLLGAGDIEVPQASLSHAFYSDVLASTTGGASAEDIILTGHSLGGGDIADGSGF